MWTDTHVHLETKTRPDWPDLIARAGAVGVSRWVVVGGSPDMNAAARQAAGDHPGVVRAVLGWDRDQQPDETAWRELRAALDDPGVVAIGEIGLDYHYSPDTRRHQCRLMEATLDLARERERPVVVHCRDAEPDIIALLEAHVRAWRGAADRVGVLHCFTGSRPFASRMLDLGLLISFSGIATFPRGDNVRDVIPYVPDDRLLLETDTPYLAPVPHRGERNEPAFLVDVARTVSRTRGIPDSTLAALTTANAARLFGDWSPGA